MVFALFLIILSFLILLFLVIPSISLAPWVPTKKEDLERIHELADLKGGQTFYDLGCGDGRVVMYIAEKNPEVMVYGIELSFLMYVISIARSYFSGLKNLEIKLGNALKTDLRNADVVYAFAITHTVANKIRPKLDNELKSGSKFISYNFVIQGSDKISKYAKENFANIYLVEY